MIGITLTDEQIRGAPPVVRQWIEQQVMASLGVAGAAPAQSAPKAQPPRQPAHLVACGRDEAAAVLALIQNVPQAVNVLFEFARPGICFGEPPVMSFRLINIQYHAQLAHAGEAIECLELINKAFAQVRGDASARFCDFDSEGHCLIDPGTQKGIAALWQDLVLSQSAAGQAVA